MKSRQAKLAVETAKEVAADKTLRNKAEKERRLREKAQNNTKKFIEERKITAMKQGKEKEKLVAMHAKQLEDLNRDIQLVNLSFVFLLENTHHRFHSNHLTFHKKTSLFIYLMYRHDTVSCCTAERFRVNDFKHSIVVDFQSRRSPVVAFLLLALKRCGDRGLFSCPVLNVSFLCLILCFSRRIFKCIRTRKWSISWPIPMNFSFESGGVQLIKFSSHSIT